VRRPGRFFEHPPAGLDVTVDAAAASSDTHKSSNWDGSLAFLKPLTRPGRIGKLVGNAGEYEIVEVVGSGGMRIVLRAFDTKLSRVVAVKVLAPELARNPTAIKRFLREARRRRPSSTITWSRTTMSRKRTSRRFSSCSSWTARRSSKRSIAKGPWS
jgi:serine/threonine protein kinase